MMNERIKQLIAEATTIEYGVDNGFDRVTFDKEKFAELIVRECVSVIQEELDSGQYSQPVHTGFRVSKNLIKQHFGVEE